MDKGFSLASQDGVDGHRPRPPKGDHPALREAACGHLVPRGTLGLRPVFTGRPGLTAAHSPKRLCERRRSPALTAMGGGRILQHLCRIRVPRWCIYGTTRAGNRLVEMYQSYPEVRGSEENVSAEQT